MDASKRSKVIAGIKLAAQALKNESTNQQSQHSVESELVPTLDSPFVPTPESVIVTFLAQLQPSDCVLDIGFGDGRVVMSAALCGHASIGVEKSADLVQRARVVADRLYLKCSDSLNDLCIRSEFDAMEAAHGAHLVVSAIKQYNADRKAADCVITDLKQSVSLPTQAPMILSPLDVCDPIVATQILPHINAVFLYMLPEVNAFLWPIFLAHMPAGASIFTYTFSLLPDSKCTKGFQWPAEQTLPGKSAYDVIRVYRITEELKVRFLEWKAM